jgi:hypothetical protein
VTGSSANPSLARATAGATRSFQGSLPNRLCASAKPRTVPGMPAAFGPSRLSFVGLPSLPRYMSRLDALGAVSR